MPINPRIALGVNTYQPQSPMETAKAGMSLRNLANQGKAQQLQVEQAERKMQQQDRLRNLVQRNRGDKEAIAEGMYSIDPMKAMEFETGLAEAKRGQQKDELEIQKLQIERGKERADALTNVLSGVQDQQSYEQAKQWAAENFGPEIVQNTPAFYDPQYIKNLQNQALSYKEKLDMENERMNQQLRERGQNITMRGQDIRMRGQNEPDQREREIQGLVERGIPEEQASDIVDGRLKIEIVPETGRARLINTVTQEVEEIPITGNQEDIPRPEAGNTLYDIAPLATGAESAVKSGVSGVSGQLGGPVAEDTIKARSTLKTATGELIRALSINPKFPVGEIKRIKEEVDIEPSAFDSGESLRARMEALDKSLRRRAAQAERDASDPSLPEQVQSDQAANASAIKNFITTMGVPQEDDAEIDQLIEKYSGE